jgi:hypothetical protein
MKPLLRGRLLKDYNIHQYDFIRVSFPGMLGGANNILLPTYKIIQECENMVIADSKPLSIKVDITNQDRLSTLLALQSDEDNSAYQKGMNQITQRQGPQKRPDAAPAGEDPGFLTER